jgi:predicted ester cyclase
MELETRTLEENLAELKRLGRFPGKQDLIGFEPQYENIVDYIVKITHRIWEEGDMGYIYDTYAKNLDLHTGYGTASGSDDVVSGSIAMLAALPNRRSYAKDVIWVGDNASGFHTSHLLLISGTNLGYSTWAPPTGKNVRFYALANCVVKENQIIEEWLVRDTLALVNQLGLDPWEVARKNPIAAPEVNITSAEPGSAAEQFAITHFEELFNQKHFNVLVRDYALGSSVHVPNYTELSNVADVRAYFLGLMAHFSDLKMTIEHVYSLGDEQGDRVALRWRLTGKHSRYGWYKEPTHKKVSMLGISHLHIHEQKIHKHYFLFDELSVLMQLASGD